MSIGRTIALGTMMLGAASTAAGQDRDAAQRAFEEATRQFEAARFQLALEGFQESYRLMEGDARAQILIVYNIARSQEELHRYRDALASFERYVHDAPSDAPSRESALDHIRDLRGRIAAEAPSEPRSSASPLVPVGVAVAGAGALALVAAIPTGVLALDGTSQLETTCDTSGCPPSAAGLVSDTRAFAIATDVLWIAGVGLAAVGATLLVLGLAGSSSEAAAAAACTEDGCAVVARLAFE